MGVYESELAPFFLKWSAIPFQHIIDVGAAEGYYAVGCAMLWPQATVTAFESSEEGRRLLIRNVELNRTAVAGKNNGALRAGTTRKLRCSMASLHLSSSM